MVPGMNKYANLSYKKTNENDPSPAVTAYTRVEASFEQNEMPLKLIK